MSLVAHLAQLRHAYEHLKNGEVTNQAELADGLLAPAIEEIERIITKVNEFPEINPSNYDHDDACALNAWGVELVWAVF